MRRQKSPLLLLSLVKITRSRSPARFDPGPQTEISLLIGPLVGHLQDNNHIFKSGKFDPLFQTKQNCYETREILI